MGFYCPGVVHLNLRYVQGRSMHQTFLLLVTLTSWFTSAAGQGVQSNCNVALTGSGNILTPYYPLNYPNNINCTWYLQSGSNAASIRLKFNNFSTEDGWDVLRVYDEKGTVTMFSGGSLPPLMSLGKTARLVFTTDKTINSTGFNASFTSFDIMNRSQCYTNDVFWCVNNSKCISRSWRCDRRWDCFQGEDEAGCATITSTTTTTQPCGGTLVDSGIIQSPNFPRNYPDNSLCTWRLLSRSNDTGIRIRFTVFNLENNYDYVTIYDEKNTSNKYTGEVIPPAIFVGKEARIKFTSDASNTNMGFAATFSSISVTTQSQCLTGDTFWCAYQRKCISSNWQCDGYLDCNFNEDEMWCPATIARTTPSPQSECQRLSKFWCSMSAKCVPMSYKCDNYNDCVYGEDEANCPTLQQQCAQNQRFWCGTSRQCINSLWRCDHANDCIYGEDEDGCPYLSTGTMAGIVAGSVCGVVLFVVLLVGLLRAMAIRRLRQATPRSNNYIQTTARPSATAWSTPATYASQFGTPSRPPVGPQGTGGLTLDQYAPPSYDATMSAYTTGGYAHPSAQVGPVRSSANTPAYTSPSTN